jgi:hypothetical protein
MREPRFPIEQIFRTSEERAILNAARLEQEGKCFYPYCSCGGQAGSDGTLKSKCQKLKE